MISIVGLLLIGVTAGQSPGYDISYTADQNDVHGAGSMPVGNGDAAANVWWDGSGIVILLAKSDAWSERHDLLKPGRVKITFDPAPPGGVVTQTFSLSDASVRIQALTGHSSFSAQVWVDAKQNVIRVIISTEVPSTVRASLQIWREHEQIYDPGYGFYCPWSNFSMLGTDTVSDTAATRNADGVLFYHRNRGSTHISDVAHQGLGHALHLSKDPFLNNTFGGLIRGPGFDRVSATTLLSSGSSSEHSLDIWMLTQQTDTADEYEANLIKFAGPPTSTVVQGPSKEHTASWSDFWAQSWIRMGPKASEDGPDSADNSTSPWEISRRWHLQRAVHGMTGRGKYPIKFNGNLFTVGQQNSSYWDSPDYRAYGGLYWHQNTRQSYWAMLGSGDFHLMQPFFKMYMAALPLLKERTKTYWGHGGAIFPETLTVSGLFPSSDVGYGCAQRVGEAWPANGSSGSSVWTGLPQPQWFVECSYLRYHYNSAIEVAYAMGEYYKHTRDEMFAKDVLVPFAKEVGEFYLSHYQIGYDSGLVTITPAQSLETYQEAINPSEQIAGVMAMIEVVLKDVPEGLVPQETRLIFDNLKRVLPPLPICTDPNPLDIRDGAKPGDHGTCPQSPNGSQAYVAHAEYWARNLNIENPELYSIFPYKLFTSVSNASVGRETYKRRKFLGNVSEWQDIIQAALLGLVEEFQKLMIARLDRGRKDMRFPGFYGVMSDANWVPDEGHASIMKLSLQYSLLYSDGDKIVLFAAWPKEWDADFKLFAANKTTVEAKCTGGELTKLIVVPESRRKDVVFGQAYCAP